MAIERNFIIKNGLEIADNLLVANNDKIGIGKTQPNYVLDIIGDVASTGKLLFPPENQPNPTTGTFSSSTPFLVTGINTSLFRVHDLLDDTGNILTPGSKVVNIGISSISIFPGHNLTVGSAQTTISIIRNVTAGETEQFLVSRGPSLPPVWKTASGFGTVAGLSTVATTGSYNDLINRPSLGTASTVSRTAFATSSQGALAESVSSIVSGLSTVATTGSYGDLGNKPIGVTTSVDGLQQTDQNSLIYVNQYYINYEAEADLLLLRDVQKDGGGLFVWDSSISKAEHDGGLFISPTVPYDGTRANLENFLYGVGETDPSGSGVWVRQFTGNVFASYYGQVGNNIADDQPSIQQALDRLRELNNINYVGAGNVGRSRTVQITGTCKVKKGIVVPGGMKLFGEGQTLAYANQVSSFANDTNYLSGPIIYADAECELFTGRVGKRDSCVVFLAPDASAIEGIVVDGYDLPFGSWYVPISARNTVTGQSAANSASAYLKVIDPDDTRQTVAGNLRIITTQVPAFYLGDTWHSGYQLICDAGNMTGVGSSVGVYTSITPANPYQWDVISGTLPTGISVSKSGWVTCNSPPSAQKNFIRIRVADASGATAEKDLVFEVTGKYINPVRNGALPRATINYSYLFQMDLVNNDGQPHYWWLLNAPKGLGIGRTTGIISGTPEANTFGKYTIKIGITTAGNINDFDRNILIDSIEYDLPVENTQFPNFTGPPLDTAILGVAYTGVLYPYGGVAPMTWAIVGSLPAGIAFTSDGVRGYLTGTATTTGSYSFRSIFTDSTGKASSGNQTLNVNNAVPPQIKLTNYPILPVAVKGQPYFYQLETTQPDCVFRIRGKSLPTGLALSETTGIIAGIPTGGIYANGISCEWSTKINNVHSRNFKQGAGIQYDGPSNVHIVEKFFISACDIGIQSDNCYDSRFDRFYIYNCRVGFNMGGGTAANTYINGRIEFIHEDGVNALFSNDHIFTNILWDTCGTTAINMDRCKYWVISNNVFFRSARRVLPRGKHYIPDTPTKQSAHINLLESDGITITGNTFIRGSESPSSLFLRRYDESLRRDWIRPYTCLTVEDCQELVITGNNMAGCTRQSIIPEVIVFDLVNNDAIIEGNVVHYKNAFDTIDATTKKSDNLFENANKYNYVSSGGEELIDTFYRNTSLILNGDTLTDTSYLRHTINNINVGTSNTTAAIGNTSLAFNGTTSLLTVVIPNSGVTTSGFYFGNDPWTFELQVNPIRNNVPQTLIDFGTTNEPTTFGIGLNDQGKLVILRSRSSSGQSTVFTSNETIPINSWTRIAGCKTGTTDNTVRIYINDSVVGTFTTEFDSRFFVSGTNRPIIGRGGFTGAADFFKGYMQGIRVTKGISRYGALSIIPTQTLPWTSIDYGVIRADTRIYLPKSGVSQQSYWGDGTYSVLLGPTSQISKAVKVERRSKSIITEELRAGNGSYVAGDKNPSDYYFNITKEAEAGTTPNNFVFQECELRLWLARLGNTLEFNKYRGKYLNIVWYARSNNKNPISFFTRFYAGTADNGFNVDGGFYTEITLTPYWRRYYFELQVPEYDIVRESSENCNMFLRFLMDDKSESYDWDFGGFMIYPADGTFGFKQFTESSVGIQTSNIVNVSSTSPTGLEGFRNLLINGDFQVKQQYGTTVTPGFTTSLYVTDRWVAQAFGSGLTAQTVVTDQRASLQINGAAGNSGCNVLQRIESANVQHMRNRDVTLSVDLANTLLTSVTWAAYYPNTVDTFTSLNLLAFGTFIVTPTLNRYSATFNMGDFAWRGVEIRFSVGAQTGGTFTLRDAMLASGTAVTPMERRFYGTELQLCQRYFRWVSCNSTLRAVISAQTQETGINWPEMRVTPTAGTPVPDPNIPGFSETTNVAFFFLGRMTPYGGSLILTSNTSGVSYTLGYRASLSAEL
ncbi:hypothetical protein b3_0021 [Synechococcus phage B3]|nr:hypothetical protein b3_0021 [Synechococcus phage B3]QGT54649.1 hypothetical protein b23_0021 [Synechococcus phage B23]